MRGQRIRHLIDEGTSRGHRLHPVVRLQDGKLVYDGETQGGIEM